MTTALTIVIVVSLLIAILALVGVLVKVMLDQHHLINAMNKRFAYMAVRGTDILGTLSENTTAGDIEHQVEKLKQEARDIDTKTPEEEPYDPFKDGEVT